MITVPPEYTQMANGSYRRNDGATTDYTKPYWGVDGKSTLEEQRFNVHGFKNEAGETKAEALLKHAVGNTLLEIGCAPGSVMRLADERGMICTGIEPCWDHVKEIENYSNGRVIHGLFELLPGNGTYDTIIAADVLEHVVSPEWFIKKARNWLAPNGRLILMTPVISDKWEWRECDFHPEHIHLFAEQHIRDWLKPSHVELWYPGHCLIAIEKGDQDDSL